MSEPLPAPEEAYEAWESIEVADHQFRHNDSALGVVDSVIAAYASGRLVDIGDRELYELRALQHSADPNRCDCTELVRVFA